MALGEDRGGSTRGSQEFHPNQADLQRPAALRSASEYAGIRTSMGPHNNMGMKVIGTEGWCT